MVFYYLPLAALKPAGFSGDGPTPLVGQCRPCDSIARLAHIAAGVRGSAGRSVFAPLSLRAYKSFMAWVRAEPKAPTSRTVTCRARFVGMTSPRHVGLPDSAGPSASLQGTEHGDVPRC
jgi:hypothetical protein